MKKRILMVAEALGGGVFTYVSQLANDMCEKFDVYVAYAVRSQTPENFKDFFNSKVTMIEVKNFCRYTNIIADIKVIKELRRIEEMVKPDIIHLHSSIAGGFGRLAFKGKNNIVVYTPHGYNYLMVGKDTIKGKFYYLLEKVLGKANCITLTCCESEDEIAKKLSQKTAYVETGVNLKDLNESFKDVIPVKNGKFTAFTLGRICFQKQPQLFNRIAELTPEVKFLWIGAGDLKNQLTAPNIEITGWKSRKEALALAKGADVFILCSLGEAIAMSLIEMMYIKKLCLVSDVVGNKSVIKNETNGFVYKRAEEYSKRIKEAMKDYPYELTQSAYNDVIKIYNTQVMKCKFIKFYMQILEEKL